ncbi:hypothetical protein BUALT_Bualt01G0161200 [Buddleja alternifolia]|uniref:Uncharacterized protein n=1 Tax=Buddleja alternifolia TaxID=168488 RepID=A0AAV6Y9Y3_9LAMI|nr:hypothetical protein BUALT_Bualt01G0161200 [Buddleja alternifolia]
MIVGANVYGTTASFSRQGHLEREATVLPRANVMEKTEDMQEEMKKIRQRMGVGAPVPPRGVPFGLRILADELPNNFRAPNVSKYNGSSDPTEHLWKFKNCALLHQYSDGVKCDKKYQKTSLSLFNMRQGVTKPLRGYIQRFNTASLEVASANVDVLSNAFAQGVRDGESFRSLAKKPTTSFDNLVVRAKKYVNMEETTKMKGTEVSSRSTDTKGVKFPAKGTRVEDRRLDEK